MKSFISKTEPHRLLRFIKIFASSSLCLLLILGLAGCVTVVNNPVSGFIPDEQEGIIFGQMQALTNGNLVRHNDVGILGFVPSEAINTYISTYSDQKKVKCGVPMGERLFKALIVDDGYFSVRLPVGRYYINTFIYCFYYYSGFPPGFSTFAPYMGSSNPLAPPGVSAIVIDAKASHTDLKVIIFDVLPNQATYIGTFIHRSDTGDDGKLALKLKIVDEYDKCRSVFLAKHPMAEGSVVSKVATSIPFVDQKQKAKDKNSADQTKKAQATKTAMDEFNTLASGAGIDVDKISADVPTTKNGTANNASLAKKVSSKEQMLETLNGYKIGVTTYKKCISDIKAGSWKMNMGSMGMDVLSKKVTISMAVGVDNRDIADLVFEGDDPQQAGTEKTPNFDKFLLKKIIFK